MLKAITSSVYVTGQPRFDMVGKRLPDVLHGTSETISAGLVARLHGYARRTLADSGFGVEGWPCEVYTMDGDLRPAERLYCVEFITPKGGRIGVQGILTEHGWPTLNHGLTILPTS